MLTRGKGAVSDTLSLDHKYKTISHHHNKSCIAAFPQSDQFAVGETSGGVTLAAGLDRELTEEYQLLLTATDMGSPSLRYSPLLLCGEGRGCEVCGSLCSSSAQLLVTVADVNDNSPVFQQLFYRVEVSEVR